jgi:hypothetical protein
MSKRIQELKDAGQGKIVESKFTRPPRHSGAHLPVTWDKPILRGTQQRKKGGGKIG